MRDDKNKKWRQFTHRALFIRTHARVYVRVVIFVMKKSFFVKTKAIYISFCSSTKADRSSYLTRSHKDSYSITRSFNRIFTHQIRFWPTPLIPWGQTLLHYRPRGVTHSGTCMYIQKVSFICHAMNPLSSSLGSAREADAAGFCRSYGLYQSILIARSIHLLTAESVFARNGAVFDRKDFFAFFLSSPLI